MVMNSFSFCLSIKLLLFHSIPNDDLLSSELWLSVSSFEQFNMSCQFFQPAEKSADKLMRLFLPLICCFSLAVFKIFLLILKFCNFVYTLSQCVSLCSSYLELSGLPGSKCLFPFSD